MSRRTHLIHLYESVQRDSDLMTGSKLKMIQVLFESLNASLLAAQGHGLNQAPELKLQSLSSAQRIIKGLQLTLDSNRHPPLGSNLAYLYAYMGMRLWQANVHRDVQALSEVLLLTRTLSDAWKKLSQPITPRKEIRPMAYQNRRLTAPYMA